MKLARPLHFTELRRMAQSPAHFRAAIETPKEPTSAMRKGSLGHAVTLGGVVPTVYEGERRGNAWKDFKAAHETDLIVTTAEHDNAMRMRDALMAHPYAWPLLSTGRRELPVSWKMFGRAFETYGIDVLAPDAAPDAVVELKTASTTEPARFRRACLGLSYHAQLWSYTEAARSLKVNPREAWIVGVEQQTPYAITVFHLTPRALEYGERLVRLWTERLKACEEADAWPAYCESPIDLDTDEDGVTITIDGEDIAA